MLAEILYDLRYAMRRLIARPGFTLAVVLTLAVGIGANVLVSDLIDGVYFRGLPYRDDASLVYIEDSNAKQGPDADGGMESIPDYSTAAAMSARCPTARCTSRPISTCSASAHRNGCARCAQRHRCSRRSASALRWAARSPTTKPSSATITSPCSATRCGATASTPIRTSSAATFASAAKPIASSA